MPFTHQRDYSSKISSKGIVAAVNTSLITVTVKCFTTACAGPRGNLPTNHAKFASAAPPHALVTQVLGYSACPAGWLHPILFQHQLIYPVGVKHLMHQHMPVHNIHRVVAERLVLSGPLPILRG